MKANFTHWTLKLCLQSHDVPIVPVCLRPRQHQRKWVNLLRNEVLKFLCVCAEPNPTAPADHRPEPEPAATAAGSGLPAEFRPDQRHHQHSGRWGRRRGRGRWGAAAWRPGAGTPQQEASYRTLRGLLRHRGPPNRLPGGRSGSVAMLWHCVVVCSVVV